MSGCFFNYTIFVFRYVTVNGTKTEYDEQSIIKMLNFFSPTELKTRKEALSFIYQYKNMKI